MSLAARAGSTGFQVTPRFRYVPTIAPSMNGHPGNFWWIPAWFAGLIVGGALLYYVPKYLRARRGINVSLVCKELPPE